MTVCVVKKRSILNRVLRRTGMNFWLFHWVLPSPTPASTLHSHQPVSFIVHSSSFIVDHPIMIVHGHVISTSYSQPPRNSSSSRRRPPSTEFLKDSDSTASPSHIPERGRSTRTGRTSMSRLLTTRAVGGGRPLFESSDCGYCCRNAVRLDRAVVKDRERAVWARMRPGRRPRGCLRHRRDEGICWIVPAPTPAPAPFHPPIPTPDPTPEPKTTPGPASSLSIFANAALHRHAKSSPSPPT